jgi:hypothetical protein
MQNHGSDDAIQSITTVQLSEYDQDLDKSNEDVRKMRNICLKFRNHRAYEVTLLCRIKNALYA